MAFEDWKLVENDPSGRTDGNPDMERVRTFNHALSPTVVYVSYLDADNNPFEHLKVPEHQTHIYAHGMTEQSAGAFETTLEGIKVEIPRRNFADNPEDFTNIAPHFAQLLLALHGRE
jgi:hypothetical protein